MTEDGKDEWVDPDDAPELTREWFERADIHHGAMLIRRGRPHHTRPAIDIAEDILKEKYPEAQCAFVAGSFNRGEETAYSDIDLVVIFDRLEHGWRESFTFGGWPVEAFVHDPETVEAFLQSDAECGEPCMHTMILEGPVIPYEHEIAIALKTRAQKILDAGPPPWDAEKVKDKRYAITDLLDDLRDPRNKIEAAALIGALHEQLGDFYFPWVGYKPSPLGGISLQLVILLLHG